MYKRQLEQYFKQLKEQLTVHLVTLKLILEKVTTLHLVQLFMVTTVYSDLEKTLQTKQLVTKIKVDLLLTTQVVLQLIKVLVQNLMLID